MASLSKNFSFANLQNFILDVYGFPDDRLFSLSDLVSNQERFTMRALKGIRKRDPKKLKINILIALSWFVAVANRMHVNLDAVIWRRFPYLCSYCRKVPCKCSKVKRKERGILKVDAKNKPKTFLDFQKMFSEIYPYENRTLDEVGVHLAEEMGELSEAIHIFLGEHKESQFIEIENEMADYISCIFGVANSSGINISNELEKTYKNNCHICHKSPCVCSFSSVAKFKS